MSFGLVGDPGEVPNPNADMAYQETAMAVPDIEQDAQAISQQIFDALADAFDGWVASDGNLEVWLVEEFSTVASEIRSEAVTVPEAIYQTFGEEVLGIVATPAQPAVAVSTWAAANTAGYTVPAGTQVTLARSGDDIVAFAVVQTAVIPIGELSVDGVELVAVDSGAAGNGLSGEAQLIDPLAWTPTITVDEPTTDGQDAQSLDDYLTELILLMRLIALRPILPLDYAILALRIPGVARAVAMDGFDPSDGSWGHARTVTLIVTDADGEPCSLETMNAVRDYLDGLREVNFVVNVIQANYETIDVTYEVTTFAEQDAQTVQDACDDALTQALAPSQFRLGTASPSIAGGELIPPPADGSTPGRQTLRVNDYIALLDRQRGVDWVGDVELQAVAGDHVLPDPFTLPRAGTITGTVTVPQQAGTTL